MGKKEKQPTVEEAAEKTGEMAGKAIKKGWGVTKSLGKGLVKGVKGKEKEKKEC